MRKLYEMEKDSKAKYDIINSNDEVEEIEIASSSGNHKKHKKFKKHKKTSRSRSNSLGGKRHSQSSLSGGGGKKFSQSVNIVEYSDVSSSEFSDPEAGEIDTDIEFIKSSAKPSAGDATATRPRKNSRDKHLSPLHSKKHFISESVDVASSDEENYR